MISVIVFMKPFSFFDVKINRRIFITVFKRRGKNGGRMKKKGITLLIMATVFWGSTLLPHKGFAGVDVNIGVNVPLPAFVFPAPPPVFVVPGTYIYAVPDVDIDIVFYQGYWYRPYRDYWYRSLSYNGPWKHIGRKRVPGVLFTLPPDYRHMPPGHQHIPYGHMKKNWRTWERERYWDRHDKYEGKKRYKEERKEHKSRGRGRHGDD